MKKNKNYIINKKIHYLQLQTYYFILTRNANIKPLRMYKNLSNFILYIKAHRESSRIALPTDVQGLFTLLRNWIIVTTYNSFCVDV